MLGSLGLGFWEFISMLFIVWSLFHMLQQKYFNQMPLIFMGAIALTAVLFVYGFLDTIGQIWPYLVFIFQVGLAGFFFVLFVCAKKNREWALIIAITYLLLLVSTNPALP